MKTTAKQREMILTHLHGTYAIARLVLDDLEEAEKRADDVTEQLNREVW